jgi:subtilase family serine protease
MTTSEKVLGHFRPFFPGFLALICVAAGSFAARPAHAQTQAQAGPQARIAGELNTPERFVLKNSHTPRARAEMEAGRMPGDTRIQGASIFFSRTPEQEADLQALLKAQYTPGSPMFHQWLTPDQFAARYGMADADIAKTQLWLQQQGFQVEGVSRSKNRIFFSGTAEQIEAAFDTQMHFYNSADGKTQWAPSGDLSLPSGLANVVLNVSNLSTFRPHSRVRRRGPVAAPGAKFTSSQTGNHFLTPGDVATIYDITPAYNAGYTGAGQTIVVVGQSAIAVADIENFQNANKFAVKDPTMTLVPNSGTSTVVSGDESESDLDLEYSGGIATGATINFVYTGNAQNFGVFDAVQYAVDQKLAPIISTSYGECETGLSSTGYQQLETILAQAASQGQTVIGPAGDSGSTDCYGETGTTLTPTQLQALAVDYPASSAYVTGMGGSEFPLTDSASTNTQYWQSSTGTDIIASALSYIPEQVWNDDDPTTGLSAGGGGISTLTARPSWQAGVTGIPTGTFRLVPDISLTASPNSAGFLYCSSDSATMITGSCSNGFRDSSDVNLTVAGGTSFDAPMFAGMVAIMNQALKSNGQGLINSTLYTLAADSTTYAKVFHDITQGTNECTAGASFCSTAGESQYAAGTGYDMASGLGSIDFDLLLMAWPGFTGGGGTGSSPNFSISATAVSVAAGSAGTSTITVTPANGYTGTVSWTVSSSPALTNGCFSIANTSVTGSSAVTAALTINTSSTACTSGAEKPASGKSNAFVPAVPGFNGGDGAWPGSVLTARTAIGAGLAIVCLVALFGFAARSRRIAVFAAILLLASAGFALSGCGGGGSSSGGGGGGGSTTSPTGSYTVTVVGKDTTTTSITGSTSFTLTVN